MLYRSLLTLACLPLLLGHALLGPVRADDEDAPPRSSSHETLRSELADAWRSQRDVNVRYEVASDSKDPKLAGRGYLVDVRIVGRIHAIRIASQAPDGMLPRTMLLGPEYLVSQVGAADPDLGWGWRYHEARRQRVATAWAQATAALGLPAPALGTAPYGPRLRISVEPSEDGTVLANVELVSAEVPPVPDWLTEAAWRKSTVSLLEAEPTVELTRPGRRVRIDRATGALLEIRQKRAIDGATVWIRSVAPTRARDAWDALIRRWQGSNRRGSGGAMERLLRAAPLLHLESYLGALGPSHRQHPALQELLVRPLVEAACDDHMLAGELMWVLPEVVASVATWKAAHPEGDAAAARERMIASAAREYAQPILLALDRMRAKRVPRTARAEPSHTAARAHIARAVVRLWRRGIERTVAWEDVRHALVARFEALPATALTYDWRFAPTKAPEAAQEGTLKLWTEWGTLAARWQDAQHRKRRVYLSGTRTVFGPPGREVRAVAPGHEAWQRRRERLCAAAASLPPEGGTPNADAIRELVPRLDLYFEPEGDSSAALRASVELANDPQPIWLNPGAWSHCRVDTSLTDVIVLEARHQRVRIQRATGILLEMVLVTPNGTGSLRLASRRPGDEAQDAWASSWERLPLTENGVRWSYEAVRSQIGDVLSLACDGRLKDMPEARRIQVAEVVARAAFDDELLMHTLAAWAAEDVVVARTFQAEARAADPDLTSEAILAAFVEHRGHQFAKNISRTILAETRDAVSQQPETTFDHAMGTAITTALAAILTARLTPLLRELLKPEDR